MIIEGLLNLIYNVFSLLTTPINIPDMPSNVIDVIENIFTYIQSGLGILANYVNLDVAFVMLGIVISIDVGVNIYHIVMWILKKIPMIDVK